jgi:hypothetical protein
MDPRNQRLARPEGARDTGPAATGTGNLEGKWNATDHTGNLPAGQQPRPSVEYRYDLDRDFLALRDAALAPYDGERWREISNELLWRNEGLRWPDLMDPPLNERRSPSAVPRRNPIIYRAIAFCLRRRRGLTLWERFYVEHLANFGKSTLTLKQLAVLTLICEKCKRIRAGGSR